MHYFTMFCCLLFFGRSFVCCMFLLVILTQSRIPSDGALISVFFFVENKSDRGSAGEFLKTLQHTSHKQTVYTTVRILLSTAYQWLFLLLLLYEACVINMCSYFSFREDLSEESTLPTYIYLFQLREDLGERNIKC